MSDYPYCVKCERIVDDTDPDHDWCATCIDNYDGPYAND